MKLSRIERNVKEQHLAISVKQQELDTLKQKNQQYVENISHYEKQAANDRYPPGCKRWQCQCQQYRRDQGAAIQQGCECRPLAQPEDGRFCGKGGDAGKQNIEKYTPAEYPECADNAGQQGQ